jgi:hypothetical protein
MTRFALRRAAALVAAAGLCAACRGADYWTARLKSEALYRRAEEVRAGPSCSRMVPAEFGASVPVPIRDSQARFAVLYYPLFVSPGGSEAMAPAFEARFALDAPAGDVCRPLPGGGGRSMGKLVSAGLSMKAYYKADATLFESLDKTAALYFAGRPATAADKPFLGDFVDAFMTLAEPGLLPEYYRANPDFWEWLRREAGRSIPKPAA